MHLKNRLSLLCILPLLCFSFDLAHGQSLTFDADTATAGVQMGDGTWNATNTNWWNGSTDVAWPNTGTDIARFGASTNLSGGTITVTGTINVGGMVFNSLSALPTLSSFAHTFTGTGSLAFATNAVIQAADNSSAGSGTVDFINFNNTLSGDGLILQRESTGTATFQYIKFAGTNPNLKGTLVAKALTSARGIFLLTNNSAAVSGLSQITVENGSTLAANMTTGLNVYAMALSLAGTGSNNGALRVDGNGIVFSGPVTLTADASINTNTSITGTIISGNIGESSAGIGLQRYGVTQDSNVSFSGTNTYTGATTFGRSGGVTGGLNTLDFSAATAPAANLLYNGAATPGGLALWGGTLGNTSLTLQGKAGTANSQQFGPVSINGTRSNIILTPGAGGSMTLALGNITRTTTASVNFTTPVTGSITTTTPAGFLGTWATLTNAAGAGSWAASSGTALTSFSGDLAANSTSTLATLSGVTSNSNLTLSAASTGNVSTGAALVAVNTVSLTDVVSPRTLDIGAGNRLRLGATGGIQMTAGSRDLTIGVAASPGTLTVGTATLNSTGQLWLTNLSPNSTLTVNSVIDNNGTSAATLSLFVNGSGNTVLTGNNLFTGATQIGSGSLEIRHGGALGTTAGNTVVMMGGTLRLAGNISSPEPLTLNGFGVNSDGAVRNISGDNTLSGAITLLNPTRINSDSGTLTISNTATGITGAFTLTIGGVGNVAITGKIATAAGPLTKDGTGTLTLSGDNTFTGAITLSSGAIRVTSPTALGTVAGATSVSAGAALEITGGITLTAEPVTLSSIGLTTTTGTSGGIRNVSGDNTLTGLITVNNTARINSDSGTLTLDVASGNALVKDTSASARSLTFGGSGNITALDPIARSTTTGAGVLNVTKDGSGTLTLRAANSWDGSTTVSSGIMNLDFSAATSPASNILYSGVTTPGAVLVGGGTFLVTGKSGGTHTQALGGLTVSPGQSSITVSQNGAASVGVIFAGITRTSAGGAVQFTLPITGSITTTSGADNAILSSDNIVYATVGTNEWAGTDAISGGKRNIVPLSAISGAGGYTTATTTLAGNADVTGASITTASGLTATTSLRFNTGQTTTVTIGTGLATDILSTGGILVGTGAGAFTTSILGGVLRSNSTNASSANADLVILQNNTAGELRITSVITNNATASSVTSFTKAGPGLLALETATHTYTGTTRVMDGTLWIRSGTLNSNTEFTLGSGNASGKLMLGSGSTAVTVTGDWLRIDGTGTANALVGGSTALSSFFLDNDSTSDFRLGMIGGTGTNENNLNLNVTAPLAVLQLGPSNTFAGKVTNLRGTIEVQTLANAGQPSSLGTGSSSAANAIIDMGTQTTAAVGSTAIATLRYVGTTDSTTDRSIRVANSDAATDIVSVVAVIENAGTGSLKFTSAFTAFGSNTVQRNLRLTGTNTGANEIVGIGDVSATITTTLEKTGTGNWALTGASTYTGTTSITGGVLQVSSGGTTGAGAVTVGTGSQLVGTGTVKGSSVTLAAGATLQAGNIVTGTTTGNGTLTFTPASSASYDLQTGSSIVLSVTGATNQGSLDSTFGGNEIGSAGYNAYVDAISGAGAYDLIVFNGSAGSTLNFAGSVLVSDVNFAPLAGQVFNLLDWGALVAASFASFDTGANYRDGSADGGTQLDLPSLSGTGLVWDVSRFTVSGNLVVVALAVPEPGRATLLLASLSFVLLRRRR